MKWKAKKLKAKKEVKARQKQFRVGDEEKSREEDAKRKKENNEITKHSISLPIYGNKWATIAPSFIFPPGNCKTMV